MKEIKIAVIGLGYVGLPLARLFATKYAVVGFDINQQRVNELMAGKDSTLEVAYDALKAVLVGASKGEKGLFCTTDIQDIKDCNYYIITMPTPVDKNNTPVLIPLLAASKTVANVLKKGDVVIYEAAFVCVTIWRLKCMVNSAETFNFALTSFFLGLKLKMRERLVLDCAVIKID